MLVNCLFTSLLITLEMCHSILLLPLVATYSSEICVYVLNLHVCPEERPQKMKQKQKGEKKNEN